MATAEDPGRRPHRPLGITVLVVLGVVQGLVVAAIGALLAVVSEDAALLSELDLTSSFVLGTGLGILAVGLLGVVLSVGLARGSNVVRSLYAAIATLEVAATTFSLLTIRDVRVAGIVGLVLPVAVLWLLYGAPNTPEFFER